MDGWCDKIGKGSIITSEIVVKRKRKWVLKGAWEHGWYFRVLKFRGWDEEDN